MKNLLLFLEQGDSIFKCDETLWPLQFNELL